MEENKTRLIATTVIVVCMIIYVILGVVKYAEHVFNEITKDDYSFLENFQSTKEFKIISSNENKDIEPIITEIAEKEGIELKIDYAGTLEIMELLNSGEEYDAVWASDSIWLYMLNDEVKVSESKTTSINPVIFAIKESKARELGFTDKDIYTIDIMNAINNGELKFTMSNPTQTNAGATAYLGLLSTIAGNPEVLTEQHMNDPNIKEQLRTLFSAVERSSGSDDFLEELVINGEYEAVVTYESSIININKELESQNKETLYALYPIDGVSISDSPFAYIDNGDDSKKEEFLKIRDYILSAEGQEKLAELGRRTWFGGINKNVDEDVFNPEWGINTTRYIVPINFPNTKIIQEALSLYQNELRKPIHAVFCLDYSGSMSGDGYKQLTSAMKYILNEESAKKDLIQFTEKDKITVIPFSTYVIDTWHANNGVETDKLLENILNLEPTGSTNIYDAATTALKELINEDLNYDVTVILMTDGLSNMGSEEEFRDYYISKEVSGKRHIPIYSIMFGNAYEEELQEIADLTNARIFDGKKDLLRAFKMVRGYN